VHKSEEPTPAPANVTDFTNKLRKIKNLSSFFLKVKARVPCPSGVGKSFREIHFDILFCRLSRKSAAAAIIIMSYFPASN